MNLETVIKVADSSTLVLAALYAVLAIVYAVAHSSKWQYWTGAAILTFWVAKAA